jgi:peptide-methionine (S)-S-oxide reductase
MMGEDREPSALLETITLGGGCFWCTEAVFSNLRGIISVEPGYSGGHVVNPTYDEVCTGQTGHAEVVRVTFDATQITLEDILGVFFATHDPTTLNRQGHDVGTQYRSVIFYHTDQQRRVAEEYIHKLEDQGIYDSKIVTQLEQFKAFYPAEDYHRNYYKRNPYKPYCMVVISPKLSKLRKKFPELLRNPA